jgi:hypothetical protein
MLLTWKIKKTVDGIQYGFDMDCFAQKMQMRLDGIQNEFRFGCFWTREMKRV